MTLGEARRLPGDQVRASTLVLDDDKAKTLDLVGVAGDAGLLFTREGAGLAGRGVAMRIDLPDGIGAPGAAARVGEALAGIDVVRDEVEGPGSGPVAIGALPFDPHAPATLVVPALVIGRAPDGTTWITHIGDGSGPPLEARATPAPSVRPPDGFSLTSQMPHDQWCRLVHDTVAEIRAGRFEKVVLARQVDVEANRPILVADVLERLRALFPSTTVFSVDGFIGASPELLVRRTGTAVRSHPLAGTMPRSGDPEADARIAAAYMASTKERHEHQVVVDAVAATLRSVCVELTVPDEPAVLQLRNVSHLGTRLDGVLADPAASAIDLCARLHPTPAVAGSPRDDAIRYIQDVEGFERGRYAGTVGWVDARGDGEFVVSIRCAQLDGCRARLYAGVGVVDDSDPEDELAETQLKLQALLAAVVRP